MSLDSLKVSWAERQLWYVFVSVKERMVLEDTRMLMVRVPGTARARGQSRRWQEL